MQLARGAAAAAGDVLLFLHADARLGDRAIPALLDTLERGRADYGGFRQRILGRHPLYRVIERWADFRCRALGQFFGDSGLFVRASAYRAAGGFPEWPLFEDVEISARLRRAGLRRTLLDEPIHISARRWEDRGIVRATVTNWWLQARYRCGARPEALLPHFPPIGPAS